MYKQENLILMLHFEYLIPKIISEGFHKSKKQHKISEGLLDKEKKKRDILIKLNFILRELLLANNS